MYNNGVFFQELNKVCREIEIQKSDENDFDRVIEAYQTMLHLAGIARSEGLLAMESEAKNMGEKDMHVYLFTLVESLFDVIEPEDIEDMGFCMYFAHGLRFYDGLIYLIYLKGILMMQKNLSSTAIREKLRAMLPLNIHRIISSQEPDMQLERGK